MTHDKILSLCGEAISIYDEYVESGHDRDDAQEIALNELAERLSAEETI